MAAASTSELDILLACAAALEIVAEPIPEGKNVKAYLLQAAALIEAVCVFAYDFYLAHPEKWEAKKAAVEPVFTRAREMATELAKLDEENAV